MNPMHEKSTILIFDSYEEDTKSLKSGEKYRSAAPESSKKARVMMMARG